MSQPDRAGDRAIIFDMDGVLIDSEPLWRRAEIACFAEVGLEIDESDCLQTQGLRIDEAVAWWHARAPWSGASKAVVAERIVDRMVELIGTQGEPIPGARDAIAAARQAGCRLALASSSSMRLIRTVLDRFGWCDDFELTHSAENEARGKPAPDVYLTTLRTLGVAPRHAIAIEDSINGVRSALAAGMQCIAVPPPETRSDPRFAEATWRFDSLSDVAQRLPAMATVDARRTHSAGR